MDNFEWRFQRKRYKIKEKGGCADMDAEDFADIYMEIANEAGPETAIMIHKLFKGQQILFPQRLYSKAYLHNYIRNNYNGRNVREL